MLLAASLPAADPLSLQDALSYAYAHNRTIEAARLEVSRIDDQITAARTRRLPNFQVMALGGQLLTRPSVFFERGVLGVYPNLGPLPGADTRITAARQPIGIMLAQANQPVTQQIRIAIGIKLLQSAKALRQAQLAQARRDIATGIKRSYVNLWQAQSAAESAHASVVLFQETVRRAEEALKNETVLPASVLEARTHLARSQLQELQAQNELASQKEQFNDILGRPIETDFTVLAPASSDTQDLDLATARKRAMQARPELQQARLKLEQAQLDQRSKRAESIPDVSLSADYFSTFHFSGVIPANVTSVGLTVTWEPFDWGRKRAEASEKGKVAAQAELAIRDAENRIQREVGTALRSLQEARLQLAAAALASQTAQESLRVARNRFEQKAALLEDVLKAQASLADSQQQQRQAEAALWAARAEFERSIGEEP